MKKILTSMIVVAAFAVFAFPVFAATSTVWNQGFETNSDGWLDGTDSWYGTIERVASGTNSIASFEGSWHAIANGDVESAPFSRFDGYKDTWTGPWTASVSIYLDPSWDLGTGFDYSVAANGSDGNHQRDFIFHVTKDSSTGDLIVAGSNNSGFAPREDLDTLANNYVVTGAGWYTFEHNFYDDSGSLAVDLKLFDSSDTLLFTETRHTLSDTIPAEVGGNRYAWFTFINVPGGIAIDEHKLLVTTMDTPVVTGFINPSLTCGALTTIHSTTVDWTDVTGGVGGVDGYEYNVHYPLTDGSGFGNWTTYVTQSQYSGSLNEGIHTVRVRAKDHAGNYSEWSNECSITTDWTSPDVTLTNPLEGALLNGEVEIRGSVVDDNPHHYWLVIEDSGGNKVWGPGTVAETSSLVDAVLGTWDTTLVPDGDYIVKLEARDSANNKDTGSVDWNTVTVENTPDPIDPPVNKDQCKNDGWKEFNNPEFKNQGQCVSYVQANEKSGKRD